MSAQPDTYELANWVVNELEPDWELWLSFIFPNSFAHGFAPHQVEHWGHAAAIKPGVKSDPLVEIINRGGGKSTQVETTCVLVGAKQSRRCIMYVSGTKAQTSKHARAIQSQLGNERIAQLYPLLAKRKISKYGHSEGWNGEVLVTESGLAIFFVSLETDARGAKWNEARVDLFIFDDVDGRHDSPATTKKKIEIITEDLLPAGAPHATTYFVQNKIAKDSIASQLSDGRAQWLAKRKVIGPIPALRNLVYEKRKGAIGYDIIAGAPTWDGLGLPQCQALMDEMGLDAFLRECQHEVDTTPEGALFAEFSSIHHLITQEEFAAGYGLLAKQPSIARDLKGNFRIPMQGHCGRYQDWGTTVAHPCVTGYFWKPSALLPLNDILFSYRELCVPAFPNHEIPLIPVSPMRVAKLMADAERPWNESNRIIEFKMSHEASAAANAYRMDAPEGQNLNPSKIKADRRDGIAQLQNLLSIDDSQPHPFRKYPAGHHLEGQPIMGRPRFMLIVANGQGELYIDNDGKLCVVGATDSGGFARARFEIALYSNKIDSSGVEIDSPDNKINDDWIDMCKMAVRYFGLRVEKMSENEQVEQQLHPNLQAQNVYTDPMSEHDRNELLLAREWELERIRNKRRKDRESPVWQRPNFAPTTDKIFRR